MQIWRTKSAFVTNNVSIRPLSEMQHVEYFPIEIQIQWKKQNKYLMHMMI